MGKRILPPPSLVELTLPPDELVPGSPELEFVVRVKTAVFVVVVGGIAGGSVVVGRTTGNVVAVVVRVTGGTGSVRLKLLLRPSPRLLTIPITFVRRLSIGSVSLSIGFPGEVEGEVGEGVEDEGGPFITLLTALRTPPTRPSTMEPRSEWGSAVVVVAGGVELEVGLPCVVEGVGVGCGAMIVDKAPSNLLRAPATPFKTSPPTLSTTLFTSPRVFPNFPKRSGLRPTRA